MNESNSHHPPAELRCLPVRSPTAHKGEFGRILVVAGSSGMHGAAALTAAAALKSGAGLVTVALPQGIYPIVGALEARATYLPLGEREQSFLNEAALDALLRAARGHDVVALGPGLGRHPSTVALLRALVPRIDRPLILDADGLNAFAGMPEQAAHAGRRMVATPHTGELQRLTGHAPAAADDEARRIAAADLALRMAATVVLKGHRSVVSDGLESHFNETGNAGMASGGVGDALTGCLAALLVRVPDPLRAARMAVHAHGRAGDLAAARCTLTGLTALELIEELPHALEELLEPEC